MVARRAPLSDRDRKAFSTLITELAETSPAAIGLLFVPMALKRMRDEIAMLLAEDAQLADEQKEIAMQRAELRQMHMATGAPALLPYQPLGSSGLTALRIDPDAAIRAFDDAPTPDAPLPPAPESHSVQNDAPVLPIGRDTPVVADDAPVTVLLTDSAPESEDAAWYS